MPRPSLDEIFAQPAPVRPSLESIFSQPPVSEAVKSELSDYAPRETSVPRTMWDKAYGGATLNYGDEIQAVGGAATASPVIFGKALMQGDSIKDAAKQANPLDLYDQGLEINRNNSKAQSEEHPWISGLSEIAGGLGTGYGIAKTAAGASALNSLGTGPLWARAIKGGASGAAISGLSGFGDGAGGVENRLESAKHSAIIGGVLGASFPVAAPAVNKVFGKASIPTTSDDIKTLANNAYKNAEQTGGILTPQFTDKFLDEVNKSAPQTSAGKLLSGDSPVTKLTEKFNQLRGQPLTLQAAQEIDEFLGDAVDQFTTLGQIDKQGKKILDIQSNFRNLIDSATGNDVIGTKDGFEALKEGRKLWSGAARLRDVEKIISRAELSDNPATAIKSGFRTLYTNPSRLKGFGDKEKELIKKAAETGVISDTLRSLLGSRLSAIISAGTGNMTGAALSQALGVASRNAASKLQVSKAAKLAELIANNATGTAKNSALGNALLSASPMTQPPRQLPGKYKQLGALLLSKQAGEK